MVAALNRVADLVAVGAGSLDVSTVPPRRLLGLATHGIAGKTTLLRRMSREHRLAVLVATVLALSARATDDALELFDLVMTTELLSMAASSKTPSPTTTDAGTPGFTHPDRQDRTE